MTNNIYCIKKGEKFPIYITLRNKEEDTPINLTGAEIKFQIKDELKDDFFIIDKTITETSDIDTIGRISEPDNGRLFTRFTDEDYDKLVCERIYYLTITWNMPDEDFSKVVSSNCGENLLFKVCYP